MHTLKHIYTQKHKSIKNRLGEYTQTSCQWFLWGDGMVNGGLEVVVKDIIFTSILGKKIKNLQA